MKTTITIPRIKALNVIEIDWDIWNDVMAKHGWKGISVTKGSYHRTVCSCGFCDNQEHDTCPDCGDKIFHVSLEYWGHNNRWSCAEVVETDDSITAMVHRCNCDTRGNTVDVDVSTNRCFVYDKNAGKITTYNMSSVGHENLSEKDKNILVNAWPAIEYYNGENSAVAILCKNIKYVLDYPEFFNKPSNNVSFFIRMYLEHCKLNKIPLPDIHDEKDMLREIGIPEEFLPIANIVVDGWDSYNIRDLKKHDVSDFINNTKIGKLVEARVRHGAMSLRRMIHFISEYKTTPSIQLDPAMEDLFITYCRECFDIYPDPNHLFREFNQRIRDLQEWGIFVNEDSIRSRNYYEQYHLRNFRKTLKNTDVAELIKSDPLTLLTRIR